MMDTTDDINEAKFAMFAVIKDIDDDEKGLMARVMLFTEVPNEDLMDHMFFKFGEMIQQDITFPAISEDQEVVVVCSDRTHKEWSTVEAFMSDSVPIDIKPKYEN